MQRRVEINRLRDGDLRWMSYGSAVFTVVIRIVAKDLGGEASAPILYLLGRWRRWGSLLFFHEVR
jgi:hypothetical protein